MGMPSLARSNVFRQPIERDQSTKSKTDPMVLVIMGLFSFSSLIFFEPAPFDALFFPVAGLLLLYHRQAKLSKLPFVPFAMAFLFLAVGAASIWLAIKLPRAIIYHFISAYLVILAVCVCCLCQFPNFSYIKAMVRGFIVGIFVAAVIGTLAFYHIAVPHEAFTKFGRLAGTYKDPNVFGPAAVFAFNMVVYLPIFRSTKKNNARLDLILRGLLASFLLLAILLSFSRAAIALSIATTVAVAMVLLFMKQIRISVRTIVALVVGLLVVFSILPFLIDFEFLAHRLQSHDYDSNRFGIQAKAIEMSLNSIWGSGPGQSEIIFLKFAVIQNTGAVHNSYVRIASENGWLALVLFVGFLFSTLLLGAASIIKVRVLANQSKNFGATSVPQQFQFGRDEKTWRNVVLAVTFVTCFFHTPLGIIIDTIHWRHFYIALGMLIGLSAFYLTPKQQTKS